MLRLRELAEYVAISAGMALATSCYAMLSGLFKVSEGSWIVLAVLIAGLLCVFVSASIAELAGMFPSAPGIRTYLRAAFGDYSSKVMVLLYLAMVSLVAGISALFSSLGSSSGRSLCWHLWRESPHSLPCGQGPFVPAVPSPSADHSEGKSIWLT